MIAGVVALLLAQAATPSSSEIEAIEKLSKSRVDRIEKILANERPTALETFDKCSASKARFTGFDWYSVYWECPDGARRKDNTAAFKFRPNSDEIIEVKVTTTPLFTVKPNG